MRGLSSSVDDVQLPGPATETPPVAGPMAPVDRAGRPPRALYLSFYFPPSRASGVFRARATANHLAQAGWDVTVYAGPREFFTDHLGGAADDTLEATVDPAVRVLRPAMNTYPWQTDVRRFGM